MSAPTRRRGVCRVCRTRQRLDADGRVAAHTIVVERELVDCDGRGRLPLDHSTADERSYGAVDQRPGATS